MKRQICLFAIIYAINLMCIAQEKSTEDNGRYEWNTLSPRYMQQYWLLYYETQMGEIGNKRIEPTWEAVREINGVAYSEIGMNYYWQEDSLCYESIWHLRQEGQKIYCYSQEKGKDELVMDFSLNVGDQFVRASGEVMNVVEVKDTVPFANSQRVCKMLVLKEDGNLGKEDRWIEGIGSVYTGILPCNALPGMKTTRLYGYSLTDLYRALFPIHEEHFQTHWVKILKEDKSKQPMLNYEFLEDTLHIYGYINYSDGGLIPTTCWIDGGNITIKREDILVGLEPEKMSVYRIDGKYQGIPAGRYEISFYGQRMEYKPEIPYFPYDLDGDEVLTLNDITTLINMYLEEKP